MRSVQGLSPNLKRRYVGKSSLFWNQLASSMKEPVSSEETIQFEIDEMKKEAATRFRKLSLQVEEVKKRKQQYNQMSESKSYKTSIPPHANSLDCLEGDVTRQHNEFWDVKDSLGNVSSSLPRKTSTSEFQENIKAMPYSLDLLDGTRWKVNFNIGREAGESN